MLFLLFTIITNSQTYFPKIGFASTYNDRILACPKNTYKHAKLPTCASRTLSCGTVINIQRLDKDRVAQCVVADRGPFGICIPSKGKSRACGIGKKWKNGATYFRHKTSTISIQWRGILDMSIGLGTKLGVKNRLVPILIFPETINESPSNLSFLIKKELQIDKIFNNINSLKWRHDEIEGPSSQDWY